MGQYAVDARNLGANLIGGCCGTSEKHIKKINLELQDSPYVPMNLEEKSSLNSSESHTRKTQKKKNLSI